MELSRYSLIGKESQESEPTLPFSGLNCQKGDGHCNASEVNTAQWSSCITDLIHVTTPPPGGTGSIPLDGYGN